jgi:hypothetical protein
MATIKRLPPTFAQNCLDFEMEIESGQFSSDTISELFELYEQAVQYYNIKGDKRFQYYEGKIQNLMLRPDIMLALTTASRKQPSEE